MAVNSITKINTIQGRGGSRNALVVAVALLASYAVSRAAGVDSPSPDQAASTHAPDSAELQEVVVTARRRDENLERVPVAVAVLNGAQLVTEGVKTQTDLQTAVPGLSVRQTEQQNQFNYSIRGEGVDAFSNSRPAVLPYINDVQVSTNGASSLYDIDSVQVLKGPQGTLFGRNATGGAVLFNTAKPTNEFGGYATVRLGNYDLKEFQGAVNLPLVSDKVLLRLAGDIDDQAGYQRNIFNGTDLGAVSRRSGRATLILRPNDQLENTTVYEYDSAGGNNVGLELYSVYPVGAKNNGVPLATSAAALYGPGLDQAIGVPGAWNAYLAAHPGVPSGGLLAYVAQQRAMGPYVADLDYPSLHSSHSNYFANTTTYDVSPDMRIKNILGYANSGSRDIEDLDGSPYTVEEQLNTLNQIGNAVDISQGSEELQLLGKTLNHNLDYIVGLYFATETDKNFQDLDAFDLTPVLPPPNHSDADYQVRDATQAVYMQGTYALGELTGINGLSATAGYRYSWEQIHFNQLPLSQNFGAPKESANFSDPSWQDGLEYQVNPNLLVYVENRGSWRGGGFNGAAPPVLATASGGGNLFLPETTHDVEVGVKYQGTGLFGRPTLLNIAVYNQWVSNIQRVVYLTINGTVSAVTANIPSAVVRGVEIDGKSSLTDWLEIGGNVAFTDAEFTAASVDLFSQVSTFGPFPDTPRVSGSAFALVRLPTPDYIGAMSIRGEVYAQTNQYFSSQNSSASPGTSLPGYALLNFRFDWHNVAQTNLNVSAFVKNATDKGYYVGGLAQGAAFGSNSALPGVPREYGLELNYKF
jgi:iron complex outermembrane recepter protein